uniref:Notch n=1 Tax=Panagrolaimus superbus TaxID=310955 RepID=A0A914Z609_9BILA
MVLLEQNCETRTDICDSTKCQNGGYCINGEETCQCPKGFEGIFCEKDQNKCSKVVCQNGGSCENLDNDFVCKCPYVWPFGYAGRYCQEKVDIEKYKPKEEKEKEECERNECKKVAGNGKCDEQCNFPGCNYDGGDCSASNPDPFGNCSFASFCKYVFRDDHCDEICNNEGCLFDGFDCQEKTPTKCSPSEDYCIKEYGNGKCNPECNSAACGWDGGDCVEKKEELNDILVLTLITDPQNFIENIASKLLITLSQLLHASDLLFK